MNDTEFVLSVEALSVSYGQFLAVGRADFEVPAGACVAVVGPNGNGKSSIAMAIAGIVARTGTVRLFGQVAPRNDPVWPVKHGLMLVPERRQLFPSLSVIDNILLGTYGFTHRMRRSRDSSSLAQALALFPELADRHGQPAGTLSGGQQQMVAIARGVASGAQVLMIDEPCLGLAEIVSLRVYEALKALKDEGRTIVLIEENPVRALRISDRVVRVTNGVAMEENAVASSVEG